MTSIITIHEENERYPVSGRELHEILGIESNYTTWFERMCAYGFEDSRDYQKCFPKMESGSNGGQNKVDHMLTLNMAKELCMLQRTEHGREVRRYLISIEEAWNSPAALMAKALKVADQELARCKTDILRLSEENAVMLPKSEFYDAVTGSDDTIDMGRVAKVLNMGVGRNTIFSILRENGVLQQNNIPYQRYVDMGCFRCIETRYTKPDGTNCVNIKTVVYQKGVDLIRRTVAKHMNERGRNTYED